MKHQAPTLWSQIFRLALLDLRGEPLLSACLIGALVAIIIPLLILAGLRSGVVDSLRENLVQDPVYREIRPAETQAYSESFFSELRALPNVEFVIEGITLGTSGVVVKTQKHTHDSILLDMLPTAKGDPLLTTYDSIVPVKGEAVLSANAASELGNVQIGDELLLEVGRQRNGVREVQHERVQIAGILPIRADGLERIYLPFPLVRDIEIYREGFSVTERGWPGSLPGVTPGYNGVYIHTDKPLNAVLRSQLLSITGFFKGTDADTNIYKKHTGSPLPSEQSVFQLSTIDRLGGGEMLERVNGLLLGKNATLLPYVDDLSVRISQPLNNILSQDIPVVIHHTQSDEDIQSDSIPTLFAVQLPASFAGLDEKQPVYLHLKTGQSNIDLPVKVVGTVPGEYMAVNAQLAGILQRAHERKIYFEKESGRLLTARTSYRGFRLYTTKIDSVPQTVKELRKRDIKVVAHVGTIERILKLEQALLKLFLFIAVIGGTGAAVVLMINLYAAIERKVNHFGHLRLLGVTRKEIFLYPVYQAMVLMAIAVIIASSSSTLIAAMVNVALEGDLGLKGSVCLIKSEVYLITATVSIVLALISSLLAAFRTTRIDPADAIRVE